MGNKICGLLITLILIFSCKQNIKKEKNSELNTDVNVEFTDDKGNKISKAELAKFTEIFNYEKVYYNIDSIPKLARSFYEEGINFKNEVKNEKAIEKFKQAHIEAPNWIYPIYNLAVLYLLKDDYENAPKGFYDTKIALHSLQREKAGDLKKGVYKNYLVLELAGALTIESPINRSNYELIIGEFLKKAENFAPLWKDYALFLDSTEEKLKAIEKGLTQNPDIKTKGILLINKAIFTNENGYYKRATKILMSIIFDPNSTISNVAMAKYMLNNMSAHNKKV